MLRPLLRLLALGVAFALWGICARLPAPERPPEHASRGASAPGDGDSTPEGASAAGALMPAGSSAAWDSATGRSVADSSTLVRASSQSPLHLNRATAEDLEGLPGIGPALATRILEFRATHGPFHAAYELRLVRGIGPRKWARLEGLVAP